MKNAVYEIIGEFNFGSEYCRRALAAGANFTYGHYKVNNSFATVAGCKINNKLYFGVALCAPNDNFSKKIGRTVATENLMFSERSRKRGIMVLGEKEAELCPTKLFKIALEFYLNRLTHKPAWTKNPVVDFRPKKRFK